MAFPITIAVLSVAVTVAAAAAPTSRPTTKPLGETPLRTLRNDCRVLVVISPTADDARLVRQRTIWRDATEGFAEREVTPIEIIAGRSPGLSAAAVASVLKGVGETGERFAVVLVGKDGGVKRRDPDAVAANELFGLIDSMPMRQREMRGNE